jgi:DNA modification methylase
MGSGTTGMVCEQLNRRWIGIELKQEFAEYAITTRIGKGKLG